MSQTVCSKCTRPATMMCQRCHECYCGSECQILDWKDHKSNCFQMPDLVPIKVSMLPSCNVLVQTQCMLRAKEDNGMHRDQPIRNRTSGSGGGGSIGGGISGSKSVILGSSTQKRNNRSILLNDESFSFKSQPVEKSWVSHYVPPKDEFFDVTVQLVEEADPRVFWVTECQYEKQLCKLHGEMIKNIDPAFPCNIDEATVGSLVAVCFEDQLRRAEVLALNYDTQYATVRLIDYGRKLRLPTMRLYLPIPIMCNLKAHAFRIRLEKKEPLSDITQATVLTVRIKNEPTIKGDSYDVEIKLKTPILSLPVELLSTNPQVTLVKVFRDGRHALVQLNTLSNDGKMSSLLSYLRTADEYDFKVTPAEGTFVAAFMEADKWQRACFLGRTEQNEKKFLVYLFDEGRITFCGKIRKIPSAYLNTPMKVFAVATSLEQKTLNNLLQNESKTITLHLSSSSTPTSKSKLLPCTLHVNGQKFCEVVASNFTGFLYDLYLNYWQEQLMDADRVFITEVLSHFTVYVNASCSKFYTKILSEQVSKCSLFKSEEDLTVGEVILMKAPNSSDQYIRGEFVSRLQNAVSVRDLDSGAYYNTSWQLLRRANNFVRSMPVYLRKVNLLYLENIPNVEADSNAHVLLQKCQETGTEFIIKMSANESTTVELFQGDAEQQSLNKQLLPLLFEKHSQTVAAERSSVSSVNIKSTVTITPNTTQTEGQPQSSPQHKPSSELAISKLSDQNGLKEGAPTIYTLDDLQFSPITVGKNIPLLVLDNSRIQEGYITATDLSDTSVLRSLEENLSKISKYCQCSHLEKGHIPKVNEICLAIFENDGEWYRALCTGYLKSGEFAMVFIDYGNLSKVSKEKVMPMAKDLLFPCMANLCFIEDQGKKYTASIKENSVIIVNVNRKDHDKYFIKVCDLGH